MNALATVATFFKDGGPFMYGILAVGVVIAAIVVERMVVVGQAAAVRGRKMVDDLVRCVAKGDLAGARHISTHSKAPVARVAQALLQARVTEEAKLQAAADDAAAMALAPLTRRLPFLSTLANVATLLGLLGTIFGLMTSFSGVGAADPAQRSAFLAAGISEALNTTAFGLLIAVPALLIQGWLVGLVEGVAEQVDEVSIRLSHALAGAGTEASGTQVYALHSERAAASSSLPRAAHSGGATRDDGAR